MNKFEEIRPIAIGIVKRNNKILVGEGFDKVKQQTFYRCLGGGIEFLENSKTALKREFREELNIDIEVKELLGVEENIFTYKGKDAHEIVFIYNIEIEDKDVKEKYHIVDDNSENDAIWVDIEEFKNKNKIIYPDNMINYL